MPLTDAVCRNSACSADKVRVRLADSGGMSLEVTPNGSRCWFWKYRFSGKEKRLALSHYTEAGSNKVAVSLREVREVREARDDARKQLRAGTDPAQQRQLDKLTRQTVAGITFEAAVLEPSGASALMRAIAAYEGQPLARAALELARRAMAILRELRPLSDPGRYVFPRLLTGERCMSENTLRTALRRMMGYTNDETCCRGSRGVLHA